MKKITISLIIAASSSFLKLEAQVGINTLNPSSTLDLVAKNSTGTTTNIDGLLIPRVDRQRAQSMTAIPISTLIYINSVGTGTQNGTAANIDTVGYYYYNGTVWIKLKSSAVPDLNIYNSNGTLTGDRTVTQASNKLAFTGTAVNAFSVDGSTFSIDAANHRLGINTIAPQRILHVDANSAPLRLSNLGTTNTGSDVLTIDATGDVRRIPFNNLLAGPISLNLVVSDYSATGNESVIWNGGGAVTITLPEPTAAQIGKSVSIVASGGVVTLSGSTPTVTNSTRLTNIPFGRRVTIFAIAAHTFGNTVNEWVITAKDF